MTLNPYLLLSIMINTWLAFYTAVFGVEAILYFFRVKSPRIKASFRLVPFFMVVSERLLQGFNIVNWLNPLSCNSCIQNYLLYFAPKLKSVLNEKGLSLVNYLFLEYQATLLMGFSAMIYLIIFLSVVRKGVAFFKEYHEISKIFNSANICSRSVKTIALQAALTKYDIQILESPEVASPIATYNKKIVLPVIGESILSQMEFEAIVAHELDHIRNKDSLTLIAIEFITAFFWWIPFKGWKDKLLNERELACDAKAAFYGIESENLADVLLKFSKGLPLTNSSLSCSLLKKGEIIKERVKVLTGQSRILSTGFSWGVLGALFIGSMLLKCLGIL